MNGVEKRFTVLWAKMIFSVLFMLGGLAMVVWYMFGITFEDFWSQVVLYFIAFAVGMIGVMIAFRTKIVVIR
jgi:hypothetical protein